MSRLDGACFMEAGTHNWYPPRQRMAMDAGLHCGSEEVLVIHGNWGVWQD
jgi:hypothetical protein